MTGPLLDGVVEKNGKVFAPGNKVLINLGLSCEPHLLAHHTQSMYMYAHNTDNQVGVAGCDMLLAVVLSQREEVRAESSESAPHTTGLKRISLHVSTLAQHVLASSTYTLPMSTAQLVS